MSDDNRFVWSDDQIEIDDTDAETEDEKPATEENPFDKVRESLKPFQD
jgi:hypothetical protein